MAASFRFVIEGIEEEGLESASRLPKCQDGSAIFSKKEGSTLYDESILPTGACQTRAGIE
jgi:hypothetical protein